MRANSVLHEFMNSPVDLPELSGLVRLGHGEARWWLKAS
jgi:hypothetical protein